jgi:hypothetical protein
MNERVWFAALVYPAPLYAGLVVLFRLWGGSLPMLIGFLVTLGFGTATAVGLLRRPALVTGGRIVLVVLAFPVLAGLGIGFGLDLSAGIVLAAAFLWLEHAWRSSSPPGARVLALQSTFLLGVLSFAAASNSLGAGGRAFFGGLLSAVVGQSEGVAALLVGGSPASMPLEAVLDVPFAALSALAIAGTLMAWLVPQTAHQEPLPWAWARARPVEGDVPASEAELPLRDGQREALASRTPPTPPDAVLAPGFLPVLFAAAVVVAFIALAVETPSVALGFLALGAGGAVILVGSLLSRRLTALGGLEG